MQTTCTFFHQLISTIDFFSIKPSYRLTFRNKNVYSTQAGQLFTIVLILLSFGTFSYFSLNMILRVNPTTIISENYQDTPDFIHITKENLFSAFGMQSIAGKFIIDESIYKPTLTVITRNKTNILNETLVPLVPCTGSDLPTNPKVQSYFLLNPINGMYCISDYGPLQMQGSLDSNYFEYMILGIEICNNKTSNFTCKTASEITNFINSHLFYLSYVPSAVDTLNYETPFNQHGAFISILLNFNSQTIVYIEFQDTYIYTDDGIILQNLKLQRILNKNGDKLMFYPRKDGDQLLKIYFQSSNVIKTYLRTYDKLQSVLAQTGGAIKILIMFFSFIVKPIVNFNFYKDLGNEYFTFEYEEEGKIKKESLKFGLFKYFYAFFKNPDSDLVRKKKLFDQSREILSRNLSLSQILNKFVEFEKLKFLLLDQNQIFFFERIPKPVIFEFSNDKKILYQNEKRSPSHKLRRKDIKDWNETFFQQTFSSKAVDKNNIKLNYQNLKKKINKSELDRRILKLTNFSFTDHFLKETKSGENERCDENQCFEENKNSLTPVNFNKILSKSVNDIKIELRETTFPEIFINTEGILKDLQTLNK